MKHGHRARLGPAVFFVALAPPALAGTAGCDACGKGPPEPVGANGAAAPDSAPALPSPLPDGALGAVSHHARDDAGHLLPRSPPPDDTGGAAPRPLRDPDWDLDADDPARDYVRRYALGTRRYGETLDCADIGPSQPAGDRRRVEVKAAATCANAGAVRDVFLVDVASDRLSVDDPGKRDPLARWPDGSNPEGPAGPIREIDGGKQWKSALKSALQGKLLVPIRVQSYGRGTYPLVTIAAWHGDVGPSGPPEALRGLATTLCAANGGAPMGLFAGLDRTVLLRVRCPADFRWDHL